MTASDVSKALKALATPTKAQSSARFFKAGPGQYGEGDQFIGVTVPEQRKIAREFRDLPLGQVERLFMSPIHEQRLTGIMILVARFLHSDEATRKEIYDFYLAHTVCVNNWDLVDSSADQIVGAYLADRDRSVLTKLAKSQSLWERRIAIVATYHFIKAGQSTETFRIADILMGDHQDLIHKAVGWMLREVGKRCGHEVLEAYLKPRYQTMPRTMLRYAIEHFDAPKRQRYLKSLV